MPIKRTIKYEMTPFPVEMTLWTDVEMARALGLTVQKLRALIPTGHSGICYHFSEPIWKRRRRKIEQTGLRYFFNKECWLDNQKLKGRF